MEKTKTLEQSTQTLEEQKAKTLEELIEEAQRTAYYCKTCGKYHYSLESFQKHLDTDSHTNRLAKKPSRKVVKKKVRCEICNFNKPNQLYSHRVDFGHVDKVREDVATH